MNPRAMGVVVSIVTAAIAGDDKASLAIAVDYARTHPRGPGGGSGELIHAMTVLLVGLCGDGHVGGYVTRHLERIGLEMLALESLENGGDDE